MWNLSLQLMHTMSVVPQQFQQTLQLSFERFGFLFLIDSLQPTNLHEIVTSCKYDIQKWISCEFNIHIRKILLRPKNFGLT